jgi:DNA-binding response OmpR family regulator
MNRVLIVDSDPAIQLLYEEELSEEGYDVVCSDGEKGLVQLIDAKRPDLIILDLKLRSRRALSLLQDIRKAFHGIPILATTAYPVFQIDLKSVGADAYVTKSSDLTGLKRQIEKCLAPPGPLEEREIKPGKKAQTVLMKPAVQLRMRFNK